VSEADYDSYYQSKELLQQVAFSGAIMKASGVNSTPSFIVNGKYVLNPGAFKSPDVMLKVVNQLIIREADRLPL
jgi:predicted DsbA family dithiol-disulfide isomerase